MTPPVQEVLNEILRVQTVLHGAGTMSNDALRAVARHASARNVRRSVETGCGATTLLLSHLSANHTVFALDLGGSVTNVRRSPLLRQRVVSFVGGPTQRTLAQHRFWETLQVAVIDGPHAYPFPDLECYFLYPYLEAGALLVLDDIHIRSVNNLFHFLCSDEMFHLDEVVRTTAFFTRTDAPTFDPVGDGWAQQRYNARTLVRYSWRSMLTSVLPRPVLRFLASYRDAGRQGETGLNGAVRITSPRHGEGVADAGIVRGYASFSPGAYLWALVRRHDVDGWWPQGDGPIPVADGCWSAQVRYGGPEDAGFRFEIAAVVVASTVNDVWIEWVQNVKSTGLFPPVQLPVAHRLVAECFRTVRRVGA